MRLASLLFGIALIGCATDDGVTLESSGPGGKADGFDRADHDCQIVLRDLGQPFGLPSHAANGVNWVVFEGHVDVAESADGEPWILYTNDRNRWWQVPAQSVGSVLPGYERFVFTLDRFTVAMGDNTAWRTFRIDVIPFLAQGADRLFDHNRYPGDFDNYALHKNETRYGDDLAVCH